MTAGRTAEAAVLATTPIMAAAGASLSSQLISLLLGLAGVWLARMVFVDRQYRKSGRRQKMVETLPLTGVAMLIAGGIIWDNELGVSKAIFTGLGVGWTAVVLLDVIGMKILTMFRGDMKVSDEELYNRVSGRHGLPPVPDDMEDQLDRIDRAERRSNRRARAVAPPAEPDPPAEPGALEDGGQE